MNARYSTVSKSFPQKRNYCFIVLTSCYRSWLSSQALLAKPPFAFGVTNMDLKVQWMASIVPDAYRVAVSYE